MDYGMLSRYFFNIATVILNKYIFQGELSFAPKENGSISNNTIDDIHRYDSTHERIDSALGRRK